MIKKLQFTVLLLALAIALISCSKNQKESAGNLTGSTDEARKYAASKLGDNVQIVKNGDLTGQQKDEALALVVKGDFGNNRYWIQKGSVIQKDGNDWKTILSMDIRLTTPKGKLIDMVDATGGYFVRFKTDQKPMKIFISMADENGRPTSDEATIKWNPSKSDFEFTVGAEPGP